VELTFGFDILMTVDFVVVRTDNEKIAVSLDVVPVEQPETVI
jgi:hypothetical protein